MITSLSVKNIALIDALHIEFSAGLNIISGETGAGKSILIDSINFVLGDRADKTLIRYGEDSARVEVVFETVEREDLCAFFEEFGLEYEQTIIVSRLLNVSGRGDCRVNGRAVTLSVLKKLVAMLVDLHGQHENQSLMIVQNHIKILDGQASAVEKVLQDYRKELFAYRALKEERDELFDADERVRKIELLEFQRDEISRVALRDGEEEELAEKRARFYNMEHILSSVEGAVNALDGEEGAQNSLATANALISTVARYDAKLSVLKERFDSVKIDLKDVADELKSYLEGSDFDAESMDIVEKRIEEIRTIKRKYGKTILLVQTFFVGILEELKKMYGADERAMELDGLIENKEKKLVMLAEELFAVRKVTAEKFEKAIIKHLSDLGMVNTTFSVSLLHTNNPKDYDLNGADKVEFLISANKGEPLKPLQKIASGGELSRFMLALKNIIAETDKIDTLIFDEIDTGISGNIAKVVAQKLANISKSRQVLVVTHLPQIAAMSDRHFLIEKSIRGEKTVTEMALLDSTALLSEIIRLTGGVLNSDISEMHAKELRAWALDYKKSI